MAISAIAGTTGTSWFLASLYSVCREAHSLVRSYCVHRQVTIRPHARGDPHPLDEVNLANTFIGAMRKGSGVQHDAGKNQARVVR